MFESVLEQLHYVEHFLLCARLVLGTQVKNDGLAPLVEILDSIQQRDYQLLRDIYATLISLNLINRIDRIYDNQAIGVIQKLVNLLQQHRVILLEA